MSPGNIQTRLAAARAAQDAVPPLTDEQAFAIADAFESQHLARDVVEWKHATSPGNNLTAIVHEDLDGAIQVQSAWNLDSANVAMTYTLLMVLSLCREISDASAMDDLTPKNALLVFINTAHQVATLADEDLSPESVENLHQEDE